MPQQEMDDETGMRREPTPSEMRRGTIEHPVRDHIRRPHWLGSSPFWAESAIGWRGAKRLNKRVRTGFVQPRSDVVGVISPPLLAKPPGDLDGLVRAEELVDPAWAQAGRGRDLADGQPRLMGFGDGPDPLLLSPFQAFRGQGESGGEPLLASDPLFQLVVGFHPSRPSIGPVAVQRTGRLSVVFCFVATGTPDSASA